MKQYITINQLNQLTKEMKERLKKWWIPRNGDYVCLEDQEYLLVLTRPIIDFNTNPRCDSEREKAIHLRWKAIDEFSSDTVFKDYSKVKDIYPLLSIGRMIEYLQDESGYYSKEKELINPEICDNLWEIVKEKLYE